MNEDHTLIVLVGILLIAIGLHDCNHQAAAGCVEMHGTLRNGECILE